MYFILYSFVGWCIEVIFCSINTGTFVNRGFLNGPVCPIYGFGAVFVIVLLTPIQSNLILLFVFSVLLTSILEFITGYVLSALFNTKWWDYSDQPFNLGGYICLKFSLAWGVACIFLIRIIQPIFSNLIDLIPHLIGYIIIAVLLIMFIVDLIVTVNAVLKLNRDLGELTKLSNLISQNSETMAKGIGNTAIKVAEKVENAEALAREKEFTKTLEQHKSNIETSIDETKAKVSEAIINGKTKISEAIDIKELRAKRENLLTNKSRIRKRLIKSFPNMKSIQHNNSLKDLKSILFSNNSKFKK